MSRIILQSRRRGRGKNGARKQPGHPSCSQNAHNETVLAWVMGVSWHARDGRVRMMRAGKDNLAISSRTGKQNGPDLSMLLKKTADLTRPTPARRDAPFRASGRSSSVLALKRVVWLILDCARRTI